MSVVEKRQLHSSDFSMIARCGEQFRRVWEEGDIEPPGFAAVVGSNVHDVAMVNLNRKLETGGDLMPIDEVKDLARDGFLSKWASRPVILRKEERELGLQAIKGKGIDHSIALAVGHATELAPNLKPKPGGVERKWVVEAQGYPFDLAGQIDLDETDNTIRDLKTGGKLIGQRMADTSDQLTIYAWAKWIIDGVLPPRVILDSVAYTDSGQLKIESFPSVRTQADLAVARAKFERVVEVIEKKAYVPTSRSNWWCSERFCGFAADGSCPFFNKGETLTVSVIRKKPKGATHGRSAVKAGSGEWWDAVR